MSFLSDISSKEKTVTIDIYALSQTFTDGVLGDPVWTKANTVTKCLFWKGGASDVIQSDKGTVKIDAVTAIDPAKISDTAIDETSKLQVNGVDYSIITAVDIAEQGDLIIAYLKRM